MWSCMIPETTDGGFAAREMIQLQKKKLGHSEVQRRHMERWVVFFVERNVFLWSMNQRIVCVCESRDEATCIKMWKKDKVVSGNVFSEEGRRLRVAVWDPNEPGRRRWKRSTGKKNDRWKWRDCGQKTSRHTFSLAFYLSFLKLSLYQPSPSNPHAEKHFKSRQVWAVMSDNTDNSLISSFNKLISL